MVLLVVKQEVVTGCAGVGRLVLLAHGDEPVGLGVIAERNGFGIDLLDLCANCLYLSPSGGNSQVVLIEEGLVVVQNLSGLGERHGVHQTVTVAGTFQVVAFDEVCLLLSGQTDDLGGTVRTGNGNLAVDQIVQSSYSVCQVVQSYVVGIAVSDIGLTANGDLGNDGVTNVVVATAVYAYNVDVREDCLELSDISLKNGGQVGTHGVHKGNGNGGFSIKTGFRNHKVYLALGSAGSSGAVARCQHGDCHSSKQEHCYNSLQHSDENSFLNVLLLYVTGRLHRCLLTFDTAAAYAGHDVFSQENKHQKQRGGHDGYSSHLYGIVYVTGSIGEGISQTVGYHTVSGIVSYQLRPHIGVPCTHHLQDGNGNQSGQRQGHHNLPQVFKIRRSIHLGGKVQFIGNLHEVLPQKEDVEHADQKRNDQNRIGITPSELGYRHEVGDGKELTGDHHRSKKSGEKEFPSLEFKPGKGECGQYGDYQGQKSRGHANDHRIDKESSQAGRGKCIGIVGEHNGLREEGGLAQSVFIQRFQGGYNHPVEREQYDDSHGDQECIDHYTDGNLNDALGGGGFLQVSFLHYSHSIFRHTAPPQ